MVKNRFQEKNKFKVKNHEFLTIFGNFSPNKKSKKLPFFKDLS